MTEQAVEKPTIPFDDFIKLCLDEGILVPLQLVVACRAEEVQDGIVGAAQLTGRYQLYLLKMFERLGRLR